MSDTSISSSSVDVVLSVCPADGSLIYLGRRYVLAPARSSIHPILRLKPIATVLHLFLEDDDAARLLRVSHSIARTLLLGYTFDQHVFTGETEAQMRRMKALFAKYDMRPTRMALLWRGVAASDDSR